MTKKDIIKFLEKYNDDDDLCIVLDEDKEKIPWKFNNPNCNIDEYYESWFTEHLFDKPVIKSETEILIR